MNQICFDASFTWFERLSVQLLIENQQIPFTVTKLNSVHTGLYTHQPDKKD